MTFYEAIRTNPVFVDVPSNTVELALTNRGVGCDDQYEVSNLKDLELVTADLYMLIVLQPDIKEGGLAIKWNVRELKQRARNIYLKYNDDRIDDAGGTVIDLRITKRQ